MSIRALHYITGDPQQAGFRCIGGSDAFPADALPWLNNNSSLQEQARVTSRGRRQAGGGLQRLSHVWEYQTGRFGCPVVINTEVVFTTGRPHGFSEYVMGDTDRAAELADAGAWIRTAAAFRMLTAEQFARLARERLDCPEETWSPEQARPLPVHNWNLEEDWRRALLFHYWKQASVRAFSGDTPMPVRVCLGEWSADVGDDTEHTIDAAKRFFADVIAPGLPRQAQQIASMAAGVNCGDESFLYTALEFDISHNLFEEETLLLPRQGELRGYRLNEAEADFMEGISRGMVPEAVDAFFERFQTLTGNHACTEMNTPFMADQRVWYTLYCLGRLGEEKQSFAVKAGLLSEQGRRVRLARACFTLLRQARRLLEQDHQLHKLVRPTLVEELLAPLKQPLLALMKEDMAAEGAEPFLLRRAEMVDAHKRLLHLAPQEQVETLIALSVRDQQVARAPQFVRCYPGVPLTSEQADERNAQALTALLHAVIRPLIEAEKKREKIENPYLNYLGSEEYRVQWACRNAESKTRAAMLSFWREEIQDPEKHFLLYGLTKDYLPLKELLLTTLRHLTEGYSTPARQPGARQVNVALHGARTLLTGAGPADEECQQALDRYYLACFQAYRGQIDQLSPVVQRLGGDTTGALALIFASEAKREDGRTLRPEEAEAAFRVFYEAAADPRAVRRDFDELLAACRRQAVAKGDPEAFGTLCELAARSPWKGDREWICDQRTANAVLLCDMYEARGIGVGETALSTLQAWLDQKALRTAAVSRLQGYCDAELKSGNPEAADLLLPRFDRLEDSCEALRQRVFEGAGARMRQAMGQGTLSFGDMIAETRRDTERAGRTAEDLYQSLREETAAYLDRTFQDGRDLAALAAELQRLPASTGFYREWQDRLSDLIDRRQVELFNAQPNLERLRALRDGLLRNSREVHPAVMNACELMDEYGGLFETLNRQTEYEAIASMGQVLHRMHVQLIRATEVRRTLCSALLSAQWPVQQQLRERSFRHALCSLTLQAALTAEEPHTPGCPDWHRVLASLFSRAELEEAAHKPYARRNLRVLQRLLATVENVRLMTEYGLDSRWLQALLHAVHAVPELRRYQAALARGRKKAERYQLRFSADGLLFGCES